MINNQWKGDTKTVMFVFKVCASVFSWEIVLRWQASYFSYAHLAYTSPTGSSCLKTWSNWLYSCWPKRFHITFIGSSNMLNLRKYSKKRHVYFIYWHCYPKKRKWMPKDSKDIRHIKWFELSRVQDEFGPIVRKLCPLNFQLHLSRGALVIKRSLCNHFYIQF